MRLLLIGHAPLWLAAVLWFALAVAVVLLWRGIRRQAERERRLRRRPLRDHERWLRNHELRLRDIEDYLWRDAPREEGDPWPNPAANR